MPAGLTLLSIVVLVPLAALAFALEAAIGFGAVLLTVTIGALLLPIPTLVPALVPLDLALCATLAIRHRREIDRAFLLRRLLPAILLGLPIGMMVIAAADPALVRRIVGLVLAIAASIELWRAQRGEDRPRPSRGEEIAALVAAGASHFATAIGGLVAVYVAARALIGAGSYRATLFVLWCALHVALLLAYLQSSRITAASLVLCAALAPSCALGGWLGERIAMRAPPARLRLWVFGALVALGAVLAATG